MAPTSDSEDPPWRIDATIPPRYMTVSGTAFMVGALIGMMRGGRTAGMQFLAENAHRAPRTMEGWYFYNKTKNYRVILGGLQGAGREGPRLGLVGLGWVVVEDGLEKAGAGHEKSVGAGLCTALVVSGVYRLSVRGTGRAVLAGIVTGSVMGLLEWTKDQLR